MAAPQGKQVEADDLPSIPQVQEEPQGPANGAPIAGTVVQRRRDKDENRGGYECAFVLPPPHTQTECAICLLVLRSPHLASCCGHNFCKECIERIQKCCPLCNTENFTLTYNREKDVSLQQFEVYCPHHKFGCEWRGKLEVLDTHLNVNPKLDKQLEGCGFVDVRCCNDGCGQCLQRQLIVEHQCRECPLRIFNCEHCHEYESTYHDVTTNHCPVCKCYPLPCPHECRQETIQRQNLEQHLNKECPLQEVECEFKYAGCEAKLPRKDMPDHLKEGVVSHMTLLAQQNHELVQQNKELRRELDRLEQEKKQQFERLSGEMTRQSQELMKLQEKEEHLRQAMEKSGREAVERQDATSRSIEKLCHHVMTAPVQIAMPKFKQHKRDNDQWFSDGFYTHPQGYKLCLAVSANGGGDGEGTHVSCYIHLMRGEFDCHLKWPFQGDVTITLLNQREDKNHTTTTLEFTDQTPDEITARVTSGESADHGWGDHMFIPHTELGYKRATRSYCQYLVNDCLYFQVQCS